MKGTGFSPSVEVKKKSALAAEGSLSESRKCPQGLKPYLFASTKDGLKPVPFKWSTERAKKGMKYSRVAIFFMERFRKQRIQFFCSAFPASVCRTVLDVGGTPQIWQMQNMPYEVTLLNDDPRELQAGSNRSVIGDGRALKFADKSFDVAFSNSVIEHVGDWQDMQRFASELRRVGNVFYCQTPNKWFPVEPHLGTLFLHWWPRLLNFYFVTRYCTLWGLLNRPSRQQVKASLANIRLLTRRDLERLFPGATIFTERFCLLSKSYAALAIPSTVTPGPRSNR